MADKIVLADTSLLIDLFRKTDKTNAALVALVRQGYTYSISAVTEYEIYSGAALGKFNSGKPCFKKYRFYPLIKKWQELPLTSTLN
jgi:tRNA(fMet)-specific endonuclease VapC